VEGQQEHEEQTRSTSAALSGPTISAPASGGPFANVSGSGFTPGGTVSFKWFNWYTLESQSYPHALTASPNPVVCGGFGEFRTCRVLPIGGEISGLIPAPCWGYFGELQAVDDATGATSDWISVQVTCGQ
jgi:hypothetical protein